jgi:hypothetical protein
MEILVEERRDLRFGFGGPDADVLAEPSRPPEGGVEMAEMVGGQRRA